MGSELCAVYFGWGFNFTITDAKLYVPIVTSLTEDNVKLSKLLEGMQSNREKTI